MDSKRDAKVVKVHQKNVGYKIPRPGGLHEALTIMISPLGSTANANLLTDDDKSYICVLRSHGTDAWETLMRSERKLKDQDT